jgi:membrane protease YdiL (CAAX protease family)
MKRNAFKQYAAASSPYAAVVLGLYVFKNVFLALAIYYSAIVFFIVINGGKGLLRTIFSGWNYPATACSAIVFACGGVVIFFLWPYSKLENVNLTSTLAEYGLSGATCYIFVAVATILNPLLEELFWRGCFQNDATRPAFIDAVFAGYHVLALVLVITAPITILAFVVLFAASWWLRFMKHKFGGLAVPYIAHLTADVSIVAGIYFLISQ